MNQDTPGLMGGSDLEEKQATNSAHFCIDCTSCRGPFDQHLEGNSTKEQRI